MHPNVTISVVNKDVEVLREDLVNTALAPESAPELVWTVADHVGPFTSAGVIQELDGQVDTAGYEEGALSAVQVDGTTCMKSSGGSGDPSATTIGESR